MIINFLFIFFSLLFSCGSVTNISATSSSVKRLNSTTPYSYINMFDYRATSINLDPSVNVNYYSSNGIFNYYFKISTFKKQNSTTTYFSVDTGFSIVQSDNFFKPGFDYQISLKNPDSSTKLIASTLSSNYVQNVEENRYNDTLADHTGKYYDVAFQVKANIPNDVVLFSYNSFHLEFTAEYYVSIADNYDTYFSQWQQKYNDFSFSNSSQNYLIDRVGYRIFNADLSGTDKDTSTSAIDDLKQANFENLNKYINGAVDHPEFLSLLESKDSKLNIYVYSNDITQLFDVVDISTALELDSDKYESRSLTLVSNSGYIKKYVVNNVTVDLNQVERRYAVRQIYNTTTKQSLKSIIPVGLEYLIKFNPKDNNYYSSTNSVDYVTITKKLVAFDLTLNNSTSTSFNDSYHTITANSFIGRYYQTNYVAFSTSIDLDKLVAVELDYDESIIDSDTNLSISSSNFNSKFMSMFKGTDNLTNIKSTTTNSISKIIDDKQVSLKTRDNSLFFKERSYTFDTIVKPSQVENINKDLTGYDWLVRFDVNNLGVHFIPNTGFVSNLIPEVLHFENVENLTIMNLWYEKNGEVKKLLVVDNEQDSSGNVPIEDPVDEFDGKNIFAKMLIAWKHILSGQFSFQDLGYILLSVISILVAGLALKIIAYFIKTIMFLFR